MTSYINYMQPFCNSCRCFTVTLFSCSSPFIFPCEDIFFTENIARVLTAVRITIFQGFALYCKSPSGSNVNVFLLSQFSFLIAFMLNQLFVFKQSDRTADFYFLTYLGHQVFVIYMLF